MRKEAVLPIVGQYIRGVVLITALLLLVVPGLAGNIIAAPAASSEVAVKDEANNPVSGAEVYRDGSFVGATNAAGRLTVPGTSVGQHLAVRELAFTGQANKTNHDGWGYHVWLTNITQNNDGSQSDDVISNTSITQNITLKKANAQIGFNIVASMEYNAATANQQDVANGLSAASGYLFDVTDGQMYFEQITVYEDSEHFSDADFQFFATVWPSAGVTGIDSASGHLYMPGPGFDGANYTGSWTNPDGFRTMVHEFGHYAIGAYDEYVKSDSAGQTVASSCTLDRDSKDEDSRDSIMNFQYDATELCSSSDHNADTAQGQINGKSVWETLLDRWSGAQWTLRTPADRGLIDPGPYVLPAFDRVTPNVVATAGTACSGVQVNVSYNGAALEGVQATLHHNDNFISEGVTDSSGNVAIYGVTPGDTLTLTTARYGNALRFWYSASQVLNNCANRTVALSLHAELNYILVAKIDWRINEVSFVLDTRGQNARFQAFVNQDYLGRNRVTVGAGIAGGYSGSFNFDPQFAANFNLSVNLINESGASSSANYQLQGAQFHAAGPALQSGLKSTAQDTNWQLFAADNRINITVNANSLLDGTGILVGDTPFPAEVPSGLLPVGGPYFVQGDVFLNNPVGLTIRYDTEKFGPLDSSNSAIYSYDYSSNGWVRLPTSLITTAAQASTIIDQYGIYAVFAASGPAPTPVPSATPCPVDFSDVHGSDYFYEPVRYLYCRSVISGYADNTFRPFANTTRGQVAKIIVLAEGLAAPEPDQQTFSDAPSGNPYYRFVESAAAHGLVNGYADGTFKPFSDITRGQLSKIIVTAKGWSLQSPDQPTFSDVPLTNPFHSFIETAAAHGLISGYADHTFRWSASATRGQISKIIYGAVTAAP